MLTVTVRTNQWLVDATKLKGQFSERFAFNLLDGRPTARNTLADNSHGVRPVAIDAVSQSYNLSPSVRQLVDQTINFR